MKEPSKREQNRRERETRILDAALRVFAQNGFIGTSMDEIAAQAGLSKPTLYQYFPNKKALFRAVLVAPRDAMMLAFDAPPNASLVDQLYHFAWTYAQTVMHPDFLSLARLIIGEAQRFPDVGRMYQSDGPDKVLHRLMAFMDAQRALGRLRFEDAELAAQDFWGLILSAPRNRALHLPDTDLSRADLARYVHNGLQVFLRAYATNPAQAQAQLDHLIAEHHE